MNPFSMKIGKEPISYPISQVILYSISGTFYTNLILSGDYTAQLAGVERIGYVNSSLGNFSDIEVNSITYHPSGFTEVKTFQPFVNYASGGTLRIGGFDGDWLAIDPGEVVTLQKRTAFFSSDIVPASKSLPVKLPDIPENRKAMRFYNELGLAYERGQLDVKSYLFGNFWKSGKLKRVYDNGAFSGTFFFDLSNLSEDLKTRKLSAFEQNIELTDDATIRYTFIVSSAGTHLPMGTDLNSSSVVFRFQEAGQEAEEVTTTMFSNNDWAGDLVNAYNALGNGSTLSKDPLAPLGTVIMYLDDPAKKDWEVLEISVANSEKEGKQKFYCESAIEGMNARVATNGATGDLIFPTIYCPNFDGGNEYGRERTYCNRYDVFFPSYRGGFAVPGVFLGYLIRQIEAQLGVLILGDFRKGSEAEQSFYNRLFFFSQVDTTLCWRVKLGKLLPDQSLGDFLKNMMAWLCLYPDYDADRAILPINYRKNRLEGDAQDLDALIIDRGLYEKEDEAATGIVLQYEDQVVPSYSTGINPDIYTSKISTLARIRNDDVPFTYFLPEFLIAPAFREEGVVYGDQPDKLIGLQYYGVRPLPNQYPYASADNTDGSGLIAGADYSLEWLGEYGLYEKLWKAYVRLLMNRERIKLIGYLPVADLYRIEPDRLIRKNNLLFMPESIEFEIGMGDLVQVTFNTYRYV